MLSMSCNDPYFQGLLSCVRDTWAKQLIQNKYENISWWSYTACSEKHPYPHIDFENHMIYVDCGDDLLSTYIKTKKAYEMIKSTGIDFNYVVRTNTSVFVNIDNMLKRIEEIGDKDILGNWFQFYDNEDKCLFWCVVGFCFIMKKEWFDIAVSSEEGLITDSMGRLIPHNDDVIISRNLAYNISEYNGYCIDSDKKVYVYKGILPDEDIPQIIKDYSNFINIEDPNIINERVIVRIRCFYDNMDRITKGHEIEHFFELNDALRKG